MRYLTFILLLIAVRIRAEEFAIQGGTSSNGRYSILLIRDSTAAENVGVQDYRVVFRNNLTKKTHGIKAGSQGFCSFEGAQEPVNSHAWWNSDSSFVALCFRTTRHSRESYLYYAADGVFQRVQLPDYDAIIYGRLRVKPFNGHYVRCPVEWSDAHTLRLLAWGDMNECHITLHIGKKRGHGSKSINYKDHERRSVGGRFATRRKCVRMATSTSFH